MTSDERKAQLRVGIFMIIGLTMIALMVVYFGRLGDGMRSYYRIRVEYSNASGLLKGASVLLAGAKIGMVENSPTILPKMDGVYVNLKIYSDVEIPSKSDFTIGSSGLLGDRFVQIILQPDSLESAPITKDGTAIIKGKAESGLSDITEKAGALLGDVQAAVKDIKEAAVNIKGVSAKVNNEILKESTLRDFNDTLSNLKTTSASFADASKKIDGLVAKADGAIATGEKAMASAKSAADELQKALADARGLIQQAKSGRGILGVLLNDRQAADNLKAFVVNLRERGILWYRDKSAPPPAPSR